jgi:hypothetical protein
MTSCGNDLVSGVKKTAQLKEIHPLCYWIVMLTSTSPLTIVVELKIERHLQAATTPVTEIVIVHHELKQEIGVYTNLIEGVPFLAIFVVDLARQFIVALRN